MLCMYHTSNLVSTFRDVQELHSQVAHNVATFREKHATLSHVFRQLCTDQENAVSTIDMFNVQINMFFMDIQHVEHLKNYVNNHAYCHYYNIYTELYEYVQTLDIVNVSHVPALCNFPKYDYLCQRPYDVDIIGDVRHGICDLLACIYDYILKHGVECVHYKKMNDTGIHIDPLVSTLAHNSQSVVDTYVATFERTAFCDNKMLYYSKRLLCMTSYIEEYMRSEIDMDELISVTS